LRQRLADVGGNCRVRSQPGTGTVVTLSMPLGTAHNQTKRK
jgi:signal transduction histidine kinase